MTEYAWPSVLRPSRLSFYLQHNTLRFVSPVTRATQVLRREGARWVAEASFEPLGRVQSGVMDGLLAALANRPPQAAWAGMEWLYAPPPWPGA